MTYLLELIFMGTILGSLYGLIGMGFTIIYKSTKTVNLAQGEMLTFLTFLCYCFCVQLALPFWLAVFLTLCCAFLLGLLMELLFLRPMVGQPLLSVIMMTIGLSSLLHALVLAVWGPLPHSFPQIISNKPFYLLGTNLSRLGVFSLFVTIVFLMLFACFFRMTKAGLSMRATADSQLTAMSLGVRVNRVFGTAWGLSALTASLGGIIMGSLFGIDYMLGMMGLKAFPAIILGGLDSIPGAIAGGVIIGITENLAGGYLGKYVVGIRDIAPYLVMLIVLMIRPYGIWGSRKIERI